MEGEPESGVRWEKMIWRALLRWGYPVDCVEADRLADEVLERIHQTGDFTIVSRTEDAEVRNMVGERSVRPQDCALSADQLATLYNV